MFQVLMQFDLATRPGPLQISLVSFKYCLNLKKFTRMSKSPSNSIHINKPRFPQITEEAATTVGPPEAVPVEAEVGVQVVPHDPNLPSPALHPSFLEFAL